MNPFMSARSHFMRIAFSFAVLLIAVVGRAAADDVYVSNVAGDDRFDGRSTHKSSDFSGPVRTLAKALRVAEPGDRIVMDNSGQPYYEGISLEGPWHSGRPGRPFIIDGNGAVLNGTMPTPDDAWEHVTGDVFRFRPARLHYQELFLSDRPAIRRTGAVASLSDLQPREWLMGVGYLYFRTDEAMMPQEYNTRHAIEPTGITLYQIHDVAILNLVVEGFQIDGINAHDNVRGLLVAGVNCHANGRSGLAICGASQADIMGCNLNGNGQAQLHVEGLSETHVQDCTFAEDTAPAIERRNGARLFMHNGATN
jgi:hypothetical protein